MYSHHLVKLIELNLSSDNKPSYFISWGTFGKFLEFHKSNLDAGPANTCIECLQPPSIVLIEDHPYDNHKLHIFYCYGLAYITPRTH